jgi:hypothetical protein
MYIFSYLSFCLYLSLALYPYFTRNTLIYDGNVPYIKYSRNILLTEDNEYYSRLFSIMFLFLLFISVYVYERYFYTNFYSILSAPVKSSDKTTFQFKPRFCFRQVIV